jgi:hypothetical protein
MGVHFSDANKFRDILKVEVVFADMQSDSRCNILQMFIFTSHNVLTESASPLGYRLLVCLRAYLELTMWESLEVHTAETITAGREAVKHLGM